MTDAVAALCFVGFVVLGLSLVIAERSPSAGKLRRLLVHAFIGYTLVVSFGVGLSQRADLWPFSPWPLIATVVPRPVTQPRLVAVDGDGVEHGIDYRAWLPISFIELMAWLNDDFTHLDPTEQDLAAAYLLERVESARHSAASDGVGSLDRLLGPLTAPFFQLHPKIWRHAVPAQTFVGLRLYRETWDVDERQRDGQAVERTLVYAYDTP